MHRRFQNWCRNEVLRELMVDLANDLLAQQELDGPECFIDAMFALAKGRGDGIGKTKRAKGLKIMAIVDHHGVPLSVSTHAANHHEVTLVQLSLDFYRIETKSDNLIGDKAYDSGALDEEGREQGVGVIARPRRNRKRNKTQDRRRVGRYERRWLVERVFEWIQWQRRIRIRWEYYAENFLDFVQLATTAIRLKAILR